MLTCSRGLDTPVPAAADERVNGMYPTVLVKASIGSAGIEVDVAGAWVGRIADPGRLAQPEGVVEELSPDEPPLRDADVRRTGSGWRR